MCEMGENDLLKQIALQCSGWQPTMKTTVKFFCGLKGSWVVVKFQWRCLRKFVKRIILFYFWLNIPTGACLHKWIIVLCDKKPSLREKHSQTFQVVSESLNNVVYEVFILFLLLLLSESFIGTIVKAIYIYLMKDLEQISMFI